MHAANFAAEDIIGPMQYRPVWMIVGVSLFAIVLLWTSFVFWFTRKKVQPTIALLPIQQPIIVDLSALRAKYCALADEVLEQYKGMKITNRVSHQYLSSIARFFIYEAKGLHAQYLNLSELRLTDQKLLCELIALYYPSEFEEIERGTVEEAVTKAKGMIQSWS